MGAFRWKWPVISFPPRAIQLLPSVPRRSVCRDFPSGEVSLQMITQSRRLQQAMQCALGQKVVPQIFFFVLASNPGSAEILRAHAMEIRCLDAPHPLRSGDPTQAAYDFGCVWTTKFLGDCTAVMLAVRKNLDHARLSLSGVPSKNAKPRVVPPIRRPGSH